jgi:SAM-dependent methyltransferase
VHTVFADLDRGDTLSGKYDLVISNMTLHHIRQIKPLIDQFYNVTVPGGHLCVTDLDLDDGKFHDDNTGVFHFGFDRDGLRRVFTAAGFVDIRDGDAAEVVRPDGGGATRRFTVFIMTGRKPENGPA